MIDDEPDALPTKPIPQNIYSISKIKAINWWEFFDIRRVSEFKKNLHYDKTEIDTTTDLPECEEIVPSKDKLVTAIKFPTKRTETTSHYTEKTQVSIEYPNFKPRQKCPYTVTINIEKFRTQIISDSGEINYDMIKELSSVEHRRGCITHFKTIKEDRIKEYDLGIKKETETFQSNCKHYLTRDVAITDSLSNITVHPVECLICNKQFINY